jgi:hypothetical protein
MSGTALAYGGGRPGRRSEIRTQRSGNIALLARAQGFVAVDTTDCQLCEAERGAFDVLFFRLLDDIGVGLVEDA